MGSQGDIWAAVHHIHTGPEGLKHYYKLYHGGYCHVIPLQLLIRKKSIFDHPILASVWFWLSNSKTEYLWPSNYQNRSNLTIGLFWWVVLIFLFTIKSLDLEMIITFCPYLRFRSFLRSHIRNGELYLLKYSSYYFITICYVILMLLCKNNNIRKVKNNYKIIWTTF